jgi:hypothetical protein
MYPYLKQTPENKLFVVSFLFDTLRFCEAQRAPLTASSSTCSIWDFTTHKNTRKCARPSFHSPEQLYHNSLVSRHHCSMYRKHCTRRERQYPTAFCLLLNKAFNNRYIHLRMTGWFVNNSVERPCEAIVSKSEILFRYTSGRIQKTSKTLSK